MRVARCIAYATLIAVAGCQSNHSSLTAAGPQAKKIEWLYWVIFWISLIVFVLVIAFFAGGVAKSRIDEAEMAPVLPQDEGRDRPAKSAVSIAIAITVVTLFVVLVLSIVTGKSAAGLTSNNPITIEVIGHQWWWEARYPSPQADLTAVTANEIHLPVGKPITILTASRDVIHSFWAPNLNGKRDLMPGYQTAFSFQVDTAGIYRGQCAEYCGEQHAHMGFEIVAEPADQFDAWLQQQRKPAIDTTDATALRGREVGVSGRRPQWIAPRPRSRSTKRKEIGTGGFQARTGRPPVRCGAKHRMQFGSRSCALRSHRHTHAS